MSKQSVFDEKEVTTKKSLTSTSASSASQSTLPSILCYCGASILMTIVNKFIVSGSSFNMTFLLLAIQSIVCVACVETVKKAGIISYRDLNAQDAKAWFPISFMLVVVIYSGSKSLQYLSIPLYTIFKNLTIILIYGEVLWFGGKVTPLTLFSFFLMVFSSVVAAVTDVKGTKDIAEILPPASSAMGLGLGFEMMTGVVRQLNVGYMWMTLNCLASASYVLAMRIRIKVTGFSDWDSMYYNNLLTIPVLVVFSLLTESWTSTNLALNFPAETRSFLLFTIAFSGAAAVGISYSTAWCVRTTSSTTYSMVGALNKLPVAISGMLFFGDLVTFGSITAIALGCMSGVIYAVAKNNQKKSDARAQAKTSLPTFNNRQS